MNSSLPPSLSISLALQAETGMRIDQQITFGPNDTEVLLQFVIQDDGTALEPSEEFEWVLNILSPTDDGVSIMLFNVTTILIVDDDGKYVYSYACVKSTLFIDTASSDWMKMSCYIQTSLIREPWD